MHRSSERCQVMFVHWSLWTVADVFDRDVLVVKYVVTVGNLKAGAIWDGGGGRWRLKNR